MLRPDDFALPASVTPAALAGMADAVRSWETFITQGKQHIAYSKLEYVLRVFNSALAQCPSIEQSPNATT
jgi:hypothetical protein